jgi:hypothetical protein
MVPRATLTMSQCKFYTLRWLARRRTFFTAKVLEVALQVDSLSVLVRIGINVQIERLAADTASKAAIAGTLSSAHAARVFHFGSAFIDKYDGVRGSES